tara:strand:- start:36 stop:206 length:171 start_codon:yes stop_codon:yes gene_type:complete
MKLQSHTRTAQNLILQAIAQEYFKLASSEKTQAQAQAVKTQLRRVETLFGWTHGTL